MTAPVLTPYRSSAPTGGGNFAQLLRSEWTKFRTVRGWVVAILVAALVTVLISVLTGANSSQGCPYGPCKWTMPTGPGGEGVTDTYYFVHQPLSGNGTITTRVTSLTGLVQEGLSAQGTPHATTGVQPWSKAGLIVTSSTDQGAPYAAVMITGDHGARMQSNYVNDIAGSQVNVSTAAPAWLRLTRAGDTLTGYDSTDGTTWTQIGTVDLAGLPSTAQVGLFATSPQYVPPSNLQLFSGSGTSDPTSVTATFDRVALQGDWSGGAWHGTSVAVPFNNQSYAVMQNAGFSQADGGFKVTGSGDIAPAEAGSLGAGSVQATLQGAFAAMIAVVVLGALFITVEYRRGLIRLTLAATPRRGRILAAKAVVLGLVTFVAGLIGALAAVLIGRSLLLSNGNAVIPITTLTEVRMIVGTAALLAVGAVFALGVGAMLRNSAGAVTAVISAIVLPYLLASTINVFPLSVAQWLLRVTPAAGFAVQQAIPQYAQVSDQYTPQGGYFPLPPLAGLAVLFVYAAVALALAIVMMRKRDA
jgi:ABC-type transport system involved in multi-copper enzyme maturation permease subunit